MQQLDSRSERRGPGGGSPAALPQFDLQPAEVVDPDRTMERLPALSSSGALPAASQPTAVAADREPSSETEPDMASTVELVPEVSTSDILAAEPLVLSRRPALPVDLDRLLAQARAETNRSGEFFRAAPLAGPLFPARAPEPTPIPMVLSAERSDVAEPARLAPARSRRASAWALMGFAAAALLTVGAAVSRSSASSGPPAPAVATPSADEKSAKDRPAAPEVRANDSIPAVAVQSLPQVQSATISLAAVAAAHRLFVDGRLAPTGSATVTCGSHLVQVGSRGVRRQVQVPCGQELVVAN